ncbi:MAG: hypothetical protein D8M28_10695 [Proteobacteria bacterium]|nr:hypothetical protein [Pseudomonadota bacterium]
MQHFTLKYLQATCGTSAAPIYNTSVPALSARPEKSFFLRSVLKMSQNTQNAGLGRFLQDGLTVAVFIGLLLTLQAAVMKEQAQLHQTAPVTIAAIPDVTDLMVAGNTADSHNFDLSELYAARYVSEAEMHDLQNIAPAAGD